MKTNTVVRDSVARRATPWREAALALALLLTVSWAATPAAAGDALDPANVARALSNAYADLAERIAPSIVGITTESVEGGKAKNATPDEDIGEDEGDGEEGGDELPDAFREFRHFFGPNADPRFRQPSPRRFPQRRSGVGAGVILDDKGHILTNNHVVEDADKLTVVLHDETRHTAEVVGTDPESDLAVIRLTDYKGKLVPTRLGDSEAVRIGNIVMAIGAPFSQVHSFTMGIVSGKNRQLGAPGISYENYIQTDAAINPGNSGGPLVNLDGEVVGINTIISTRSGASAGVGFAVPSNLARNVVRQLIEKGRVTRGWIGVSMHGLDDDMRKALGVAEGGVMINSVVTGSPAEKAELRRGDVILAFNGKTLKDARALLMAVADVDPGKTATMEILRAGEKIQVEITLEERTPEALAQSGSVRGPRREGRGGSATAPTAKSEKLGLTVRPMRTEESQRFNGEKGLIVSNVTANGPAHAAGLLPGILLIQIRLQDVTELDTFRKIEESLADQEAVLLLVCPPGGEPTFRALNLAGK